MPKCSHSTSRREAGRGGGRNRPRETMRLMDERSPGCAA
jgi:hypothetical protein